MQPLNLTIYNEFIHERNNELVGKLYPDGIHEAIAGYMRKQPGIEVRTATLDMEDHGLTEEVLASTDVLIWWGHAGHDKVRDDIVDRIQARVLDGMGLIVLHSGHFSKVFKRMMGTSCGLCWREDDGRERIWVVNPSHPIARGVGRYLELPYTEMYGEVFDVPDPDELIFISWFEGGEVFRSGMTWHRGKGRIFYFRPGHETYPIFHNEGVLHILANGVRWAKFEGNTDTLGIGTCYHAKEPIEELSEKDYDSGNLDHPDMN